MKIFTASCIIITAFLVAWTRHRILEWQVWVSELETILFQESDVGTAADTQQLPLQIYRNRYKRTLKKSFQKISMKLYIL